MWILSLRHNVSVRLCLTKRVVRTLFCNISFFFDDFPASYLQIFDNLFYLITKYSLLMQIVIFVQNCSFFKGSYLAPASSDYKAYMFRIRPCIDHKYILLGVVHGY